jgi:hypothetical protein
MMRRALAGRQRVHRVVIASRSPRTPVARVAARRSAAAAARRGVSGRSPIGGISNTAERRGRTLDPRLARLAHFPVRFRPGADAGLRVRQIASRRACRYPEGILPSRSGAAEREARPWM